MQYVNMMIDVCVFALFVFFLCYFQYAGKWYEIRRLYDPDDVELEDCVQEQYTQSEEKLDYEIVRAVQQGPTGEVIYSTGTATPKVFHNSKVPKFIVRYNTTDPADPG